jgi:cystathionine beta-lyase/cystathionine gamma-synthase
MKEHMKNGLAVARYLEKHPFVDKVVHPGKIYNTLRNTHLLIKLYMYPGKHI